MKLPSELPLISVLIPVYNCAPFVSQALDSILGQTYTEFEIIAVDDGSDDGSSQILDTYAARDPRLHVIRNPNNLGIVRALNRGLSTCRGTYVARMDADDIACKERFEKQISEMESQPDIIALGGAVSYIDAAGNNLGLIRRCSTGRSLLHQNPLLHPTVMIRRSALQEHQLQYEESYRYAEDYFLWLRLSRVGRLASLDDVLLFYRLTSGASRFKHARIMVVRTLKTKLSGVFKLGIRPAPFDIIRFAAECLLALMPAPIIRLIYLRHTFGTTEPLL